MCVCERERERQINVKPEIFREGSIIVVVGFIYLFTYHLPLNICQVRVCERERVCVCERERGCVCVRERDK